MMVKVFLMANNPIISNDQKTAESKGSKIKKT